MTKPQPKKIHGIQGDEDTSPQQADVVEVVVQTMEVTPEGEIALKRAAAALTAIASSPSVTPAPSYSTAFYQANNIPTCPNCGEKYRTDRSGLPLCPVDAVDCPRLK